MRKEEKQSRFKKPLTVAGPRRIYTGFPNTSGKMVFTTDGI
jgi:hypothetical protein